MSGVRMLHFLKNVWKFIWIHQYYTMALKVKSADRTPPVNNHFSQQLNKNFDVDKKTNWHNVDTLSPQSHHTK